MSIAAAAYIVSDWDQSEHLREVATILYLVITICLCVHATILIQNEKKAQSESLSTRGDARFAWLNVFRGSPGLGLTQNTPPEYTYTVYFYCPILLLLLIRQAYLLSTFGVLKDQRDNEKYWYPLFATPEFLVACFFSAPGLVPRLKELPEDEERSYWSKLWRAYNGDA